MKIIYVGADGKKRRKYLDGDEDVLLLLFDRWDDYDYKTTFPTSCNLNGSLVELGGVRILVEDEMVTFDYFNTLLEGGWDGLFPPPAKPYISTPDSLSFYEQILGIKGLSTAMEVARTLGDASYLTRISEDKDALRLVATRGFTKSLQREQGSVKAFLDGWKLFAGQNIFVENQVFRYRASDETSVDLELRFASESILPHDINVLIGPNGIGKSQLLLQMVTDWLTSGDDGKDETTGFTSKVNINQLVVVSYSPFELFPVGDVAASSRRDSDFYRYFGLRGKRGKLSATGKSDQVVLSREIPKSDAAESLLACLSGDQKFAGIREWSNRLRTMEKVLKTSIDFDVAAVAVDAGVEVGEFYRDDYAVEDLIYTSVLNEGQEDQERIRYIPITSFNAPYLRLSALRRHSQLTQGVEFLKNGKRVFLSSGQKLFSYIVINILGTIRRNSLLLIDEPELFLHPTLEIALVSMLKAILQNFGSKALIATHSVVTVREMPSDCVHVMERTDEGLFIKRPPFETFGGDVQKISSYVFGDKSVSKPFEHWLVTQLEAFDGNAEALIERLGTNINEELMIQIHAMGEGKW